MKTLVLISVMLMSSLAFADGNKVVIPTVVKAPVTTVAVAAASPCPDKPMPKHRKHAHKAAPQAPQCQGTTIMVTCPCTKGEKGATGPKGAKGATGPQGKEGTSHYNGLNPGIGYMGTAFFPKRDYAWAHGLSLRFNSQLSDNNELLIQVSLAQGRDRAVTGQVSVVHWLQQNNDVGLSFGAVGQVIGLNGKIDNGYYGGALFQLNLRQQVGFLNLNFEAGPSIGLADYSHSSTDAVFGFVGSAGVSVNFN